jgi:carboxypeptidase T
MRLFLSTLLMVFAISAMAAEEHTMVRFYVDSLEDQLYIDENPDALDLTEAGRRGEWFDIVTMPEDIELLSAKGFRFEILQTNLESFYAAQYTSSRSNFGIYHTYSESAEFVDSLRLRFPEVISEKWSIGQTHEGNEIWCFRVSDNPDVDENEPEILFDGMHHAREIMASEICIMLGEYLGENYGTDPEVTALVNSREIYIVPIGNPDGVLYNEQTNPNGGGMWRKNRRNNGSTYGVDMNRNYPYEWGCDWGSSGNPGDDTYRGPSPGSEPEVQAFMNFINAHDFTIRQSFHTYGDLTLYPWGYTTSDTPDEAMFREMATQMVMYNGYTPGQPGDVLYDVCGGNFDWDYGAQDEHGKIFAFTTEIGSSFWPSESLRQPYFDENVWPCLYLIQMAGSLTNVTFDHDQLPFTADYFSSYAVEAEPHGYGGAAIVESSVKLNYRVNGGAFVELGMTHAGAGLYTANIPAQVQGSIVEYYLYAEDVGGNIGTAPFNAPATLYYFETGESFTHDMEADRGWTVGADDDDASTGTWVRVDPYPTGSQPGDDHSADGTDCWITGQQQPGDSDGANDIDNGKTTLFSPVYDMSGAESLTFTYWKWYSNDQGSDPNTDYWNVDLSNNSGGTWTSLEHTTASTNAWAQMNFDHFTYFGEAGLVQLRFEASDEGSGSLVEGGVDDFLIVGVFDASDVDDGETLPFRVQLSQNVPNPFNPKTDIAFALTQSGPVSLKVYDVSGRLLSVLVDDVLVAGEHQASWDGRALDGRSMSSGVYFYRLEAENKVMAKRMVILK